MLGQNLAIIHSRPGPAGGTTLPPCARAPAPVAPLSHHEILGLVEPFTRSGRHVGLAASDRAARRLGFKPVEHATAGDNQPALREGLQLEDEGRGRWRLTRQPTLPGGLQSALHAERASRTELLARVAAIPLQRQSSASAGVQVAKQQRLEGGAAAPADTPVARAALAEAPVLMSQATAQVDGQLLRFKVSALKGIQGEFGLESTGQETPARLHDQRVAARWRVVARRAPPLIGSAAMIAAAALFAKLESDLAQDSVLRTLGADLPRSRTPWQQVLRRQLARALTPRFDVSWLRPARSHVASQGRNTAGHRMPWERGFSMARRVPRLVVVVDVSGSIADKLLECFAREVDTITRRLEAGLGRWCGR